MRRNIFAYTAPGHNYPEYLSINVEEDGTISVTVRNGVKLEGACGETASIRLSLLESVKLAQQLTFLGEQ